jgi:hypothetical protein
MDSQQVEILGRAALTAQLMRDGVEVAQPDRDRGVDLVAYTTRPWRAVPLQLKVATTGVFSAHKKYEAFDRLVMAYVWYAATGMDAEIYAMPYTVAVGIAETLGWTEKPSWIEKGGYGSTHPGEDIKALLVPHRMVEGSWIPLMERALGDSGALRWP